MPKFELDECEKKRLTKMMSYERRHHKNGFKAVAGIDEAGRGPLAGPVVQLFAYCQNQF